MSALSDSNHTIEELNDEKAIQLIAVMVYVGFLMIIGFIGNITVGVYFGYKARRTSTTMFISLLAVFDLTACTIAMPGEILDIRYFFAYEDVFMCKLSKFINHLTAAGSSITLVIIAIDRHRRICSPLRRQMQVKHAIVCCSVALAIALLFAWPSLIFYGPTEVGIPVPSGRNVTLTGHDCTTTKDEQFGTIILIFNGIYLLIFLILALSVISLYTKIGRVVLKHNKSSAVRISSPTATSQSTADNTVVTEVSGNSIELHKVDADAAADENNIDGVNTIPADSMPKEKIRKCSYTVTGRQPRFETKKQVLDSRTVKSTMIMITVTAAFIISCLPYLALVIWRAFEGRHETEFLSDTELVLFEIGMRSYLLNNAINPILYGFLNGKFRQFVLNIICSCSCK